MVIAPEIREIYRARESRISSAVLVHTNGLGVALVEGQRGLGRCARGWCDSCAFWGGPVVAEGGLHHVERDEGHLQPPVSRHTSTIVHQHTSSPTTPKP